MAFDGNGTFVRLFNWVSDKVNNINITASRVDSEDSGFAAGLTLCVTRDGQGKMAADFLPSADNTLKLGSASFRWSQLNGVIVFSANNNVTVNSPLTGIALTVNGINGQNTVAMQGGATAGQSFGLAIAAGTNSSDRPLQIKDTTNTTNYFLIRGDGLAQAVDQGGTLQDVGWRDAPQNLANANYGLVLSDRGKSITHSSGAPHTWTIPANGTVVFPIGTTILLVVENAAAAITLAITTDTLVWAPSGATGSRTLTGPCMATLHKYAGTTWLLSGAGIS